MGTVIVAYLILNLILCFAIVQAEEEKLMEVYAEHGAFFLLFIPGFLLGEFLRLYKSPK